MKYSTRTQKSRAMVCLVAIGILMCFILVGKKHPPQKEVQAVGINGATEKPSAASAIQPAVAVLPDKVWKVPQVPAPRLGLVENAQPLRLESLRSRFQGKWEFFLTRHRTDSRYQWELAKRAFLTENAEALAVLGFSHSPVDEFRHPNETAAVPASQAVLRRQLQEDRCRLLKSYREIPDAAAGSANASRIAAWKAEHRADLNRIQSQARLLFELDFDQALSLEAAR